MFNFSAWQFISQKQKTINVLSYTSNCLGVKWLSNKIYIAYSALNNVSLVDIVEYMHLIVLPSNAFVSHGNFIKFDV